MKFFIIVLFLCSIINAYAQNIPVKNELLTSNELAKIFTTDIKDEFKLNYPIFCCYKYADNKGLFYTVLTESLDSIGNKKDTFHFNIKAITFKIENEQLIKNWELKDYIDKNEQSIWFWTKYVSFKDVDNDGLTDPVIIYGSFGDNGYENCRIKIVTYYKDQKVFIRHQNGTLDFKERRLQIDKSFYLLPIPLQTTIKNKMLLMVKNKQAVFPYGWQKAMAKKETLITQKNR